MRVQHSGHVDPALGILDFLTGQRLTLASQLRTLSGTATNYNFGTGFNMVNART